MEGSENNSNEDITKDPKRKAKSNDPGWKYGYWPELDDKNIVACSLCGKVLKGGIKRLKQHLSGGFGDAIKCPKSTTSIAQEMMSALIAGQKSKPTLDEEITSHGSNNMAFIDVDSDPSNPSQFKIPSSGTTSKRKKITFPFSMPGSKSSSPSIETRLRKTPEEVVDERYKGFPIQTTIENRLRSKEEKEKVHQHIADWFYEAGIAFNTASLRSFEVMIESIGQYGPGLNPPSVHEIKQTYLGKAKKKTEEVRKQHENVWKEYGCSLMSDGWTDRRSHHLINFLVNSPAGTYFLGSVDASSQSQNATMLADLLDEKIEEIGSENVVQVQKILNY